MCYWLNQTPLCFPCVCVCVSKEQCGSYERPYLPWSQSHIWSRGLCPSHAEHFVINPSLAACAAGNRGGEHQGEAALSFSLSCVKTWGKEWAMCGWACCNMRFDAAFKYVLLASFCPPVVLNSGWNTRTQSGCLIKCEQTLLFVQHGPGSPAWRLHQSRCKGLQTGWDCAKQTSSCFRTNICEWAAALDAVAIKWVNDMWY